MLYAVIVTGGKQYKVFPGEYLKVEKIESPIGASITLDKVLMIMDGETINIGTPYIKEASVVAEVRNQARLKKVHITKFRRRKHHMKRMGHRQSYTEIKITEIKA